MVGMGALYWSLSRQCSLHFLTPTFTPHRVTPHALFPLPPLSPTESRTVISWRFRRRKWSSRAHSFTPRNTDADSGTSTTSSRAENQNFLLTEKEKRHEILLHERRNGQLVSRYWGDQQSGALSREDTDTSDSTSAAGQSLEEQERLGLPVRIPQNLRNFTLPSGFPDSVSSDYLTYMLWQFPTNVTGWICSTLVTSSLLKAVGIGGGGGSAAAATAAIKWVSKDGLGSIGRLLIGGRFGSLFDEDPKQWRMYADFVGSAGSIFELATPLAPGSFLLLASLGNLTKAVAKGLKDPSFRVIQNHFAVSENVGDVVAKEEVWGVAAQLVGLGLGVVLLSSPGISTSYWELITAWTFIRALHLWLRYQTLAVLRFNTINYKRAVIMIEAHILGSPIPDFEECNVAEQILLPRILLAPRVRVGFSLQELLGPEPSTLEVRELLGLYEGEKHLLVLYPNAIHGLEARILLKEGANSRTLLRSLYQACWLLQHISQPAPKEGQGQGSRSRRLLESLNHHRSYRMTDQTEVLSTSVRYMQDKFDSFVKEMQDQGWEFSKLVLKIPNTAPFLSEILVGSDPSLNSSNSNS